MSTTEQSEEEADEVTYKAVSINITAHPHSDAYTYSRLFDRALGREVKYWGDNFGELLQFRKLSNGVYHGRFTTFKRVDRSSNWGDKTKGESLEEAAVERLPLPPAHIVHAFDKHEFVFHEREHRLIAECSTLEPRRWRSLLYAILKRAGAADGTQVNVTVVPMNDSIERLLSMDRVTKLIVKLSRPNPDDMEELLAAEMLDRLERQHSRSMEVVLTAAPRESIEPDPETRKIAQIALTNGWVKTEGKHHGEKQIRSTKSHPHIETVRSRGSLVDALIRLSARFLG